MRSSSSSSWCLHRWLAEGLICLSGVRALDAGNKPRVELDGSERISSYCECRESEISRCDTVGFDIEIQTQTVAGTRSSLESIVNVTVISARLLPSSEKPIKHPGAALHSQDYSVNANSSRTSQMSNVWQNIKDWNVRSQKVKPSLI